MLRERLLRSWVWRMNVKNKAGVTFKELIFCPPFVFAKAVLYDRQSTHDTQRRVVHEANEAGLYTSQDRSTYARIQILSIQEILEGKQPDYPRHRADATFKKAPIAKKKGETLALFEP